MDNHHWGSEEFEDLVSKSLIGMYEQKFKKNKWASKWARITPEILQNIRKIGCYFPPDDRIIAIDQHENGIAKEIQNLDILNEGRPNEAIHCYNSKNFNLLLGKKDSMRHDCYLEISYLQRIPKLPNKLLCDYEGKKYRLTKLWMYKNDIMNGMNWFVVIDHNGNIYSTYWVRNETNLITGVGNKVIVNDRYCQSNVESSYAESICTVDAHVTIQCWQDRRHIWNVTATEGIAKATFGIYPEQIKSLFYSRELPLTETGRKRPILHWVASHQRRLKNGIDIDIEKHLRGTNEFIYKGTKFIISRPLKQTIKDINDF